LYARPNDELDLARKIAVLMDDPERRREMGQKGRERVETELAWVHQAKHLLEAYHALEDGPKRRAACGTVQPSDVG
jgi:glycosyltransferase involved in cell wall biosynthesis